MIETKRLLLKEYDESCIQKAHENFFCEKETAKYTLWRPTESPKDVKDKLEYWLYEVKVSILWLIYQKDNNEPIGFISGDETSTGVYDNIGIALGTKYINKGYGSEVMLAFINHLKNNGIKEVYYSHFKENIASENLALKFGFKKYKEGSRTRRYDNKTFIEIHYKLNLK